MMNLTCRLVGHDGEWHRDDHEVFGAVMVRYCRRCDHVFGLVTERRHVDPSAMNAIQTSDGKPSSDFKGAIQ